MANHNILIVHAHPADFACDAAATMALHAERGDRVTSLVVSHGERHHMQWLHDQKLMSPEKRDPDLSKINMTNYKEFKKREKRWLNGGGKFILPYPNFKIVKR